MHTISFEAIIGAGKTTLVRKLQSKLDSTKFLFGYEPVEMWRDYNGVNVLHLCTFKTPIFFI